MMRMRKRGDVAKTLIRLPGFGTHWWANVESWTFSPARSSNPVTRYTMDAVVAGTGGGVAVTILVVDEN